MDPSAAFDAVANDMVLKNKTPTPQPEPPVPQPDLKAKDENVEIRKTAPRKVAGAAEKGLAGVVASLKIENPRPDTPASSSAGPAPPPQVGGRIRQDKLDERTAHFGLHIIGKDESEVARKLADEVMRRAGEEINDFGDEYCLKMIHEYSIKAASVDALKPVFEE